MKGTAKEISTLRELAKRCMEIALSEKHVRMRRRFRDSNDLKIVRPPVIMDEIPWHEMNFDGSLDCVCEDSELRGIEYFLRKWLFREKYFNCDNYIEPVWVVWKSYESTGIGFEPNETRLAVDDTNNIKAESYEDVLEDESSLEAYHDPVITARPEEDRRKKELCEEIFDGIMPVEVRGHQTYYSPWDKIARLRGVEPILIDMYERPEYLHRIMELFTRAMLIEMDQKEAPGLYDPRSLAIHCTPAAVTVPNGSTDGHYGCKDVWFRTMAQMFSSVSPEMHDEFDIQYSLPLAKRFAFTYYGCCEPLHDRLDKVKQYPNLRKVGVTPWADVEKCAEQLGGDYVMARKPNPANVAIKTDPEQIRKEIGDTVCLCQKYGCQVEFVLKDISTVGYKPENLIVWAQTVSDVLDEYYDRA